jgi:hypothetical protein
MADSGTSGQPTNTGFLYHFTGGAWSTYPVPLGGGNQSWIEAIWATSPTDAWGVGFAATGSSVATSTGIVTHWDGSSWTLMDSPTSASGSLATDFTYVWGSIDDAWVAGTAAGGSTTGALFHWNGSVWEDGTLSNLNGVGGLWGSGPSDVWLWAEFSGTADESLVHWNGTAWATVWTLPDAWSYGNAIGGSGMGDAWAVGSGGMILHHS